MHFIHCYVFKSKYFIQSFCMNGLFTNLKEKSSVERIVGGLKMCIFFLFLITLTPFLWILNWHKNFQYYIFTFIWIIILNLTQSDVTSIYDKWKNSFWLQLCVFSLHNHNHVIWKPILRINTPSIIIKTEECNYHFSRYRSNCSAALFQCR